jgi:murein DD-endopeptidase MepM/ murein hydrolase activator NlpD
VSLVLSLLLVFLYSVLLDTPREREVKRENQDLARDYELLSEKYAKIDTVLNELKLQDENIYRAIFETDPLEEEDLKIDYDDYNKLFRLSNERILDSTIHKLQLILDVINVQDPEYSNLMNNAERKEEMLKSIPAIQPILNKDLSRLASGFGNRMHPMYKIVRFHEGMDYTAPSGTEVFATGDGIVEEVDNSRRGRGNTLIINHGFQYSSVYSHLDKFNVKKGQSVRRGEVIAWVGNTGLSVAPHLHYEVRLKGKPVNPVNYYFLELSPSEYYKMIDLSVKSGQSFD